MLSLAPARLLSSSFSPPGAPTLSALTRTPKRSCARPPGPRARDRETWAPKIWPVWIPAFGWGWVPGALLDFFFHAPRLGGGREGLHAGPNAGHGPPALSGGPTQASGDWGGGSNSSSKEYLHMYVHMQYIYIHTYAGTHHAHMCQHRYIHIIPYIVYVYA